MNELAGQSLGGYTLEEEVGRGSMGVVYRGTQIALGREVAIKVLPQTLARDASYVARFIREAQIIAGLNHPNIVQIYDAGEQNKLLYFVMEYVQGPTLASLLHLDGIIPQHLAAEYAAQIAEALDVAYRECHVIHRDIKPENLMLNRWGKIKVMDFGLARAHGHQAITMAKTLVGSIYYASPEQIWGQVLDNRSDIYALGVVLYEMVTGHLPFSGRSMPELTQAIIGGPLTSPGVHNAELSPQLEQIILLALARDRTRRYADAAVLARELRALQLQPPAPPSLSTFSGMEHGPAGIQPPYTLQNTRRHVMRPPRRPQAQRPLYDIDLEVDKEPTRPLLLEEAHSAQPAPPAHAAYTAQEMQEVPSSMPFVPFEHQQFFQQKNQQEGQYGQYEEQDEAQHVDGPTRPLQKVTQHFPQPVSDTLTGGIALRALEPVDARHGFWEQLHRLFKLSSRYGDTSTQSAKKRKTR